MRSLQRTSSDKTPRGSKRHSSQLEILPNPELGPFVKEDGEVVRSWRTNLPEAVNAQCSNAF